MKYKLNKKRTIIASILLLVIVGLFSIGGHKIYKSIKQNAVDYNESSTTPEYYWVTFNYNPGINNNYEQDTWPITPGNELTFPSDCKTTTDGEQQCHSRIIDGNVVDGYTITGWKRVGDDEIYLPGDQYTPTADDTFEAVWEAAEYSITLDTNGGSFDPSSTPTSYTK